MTTPVGDKTQIPAKVWRRHSDPPGLWILAGTISLCLHLLVFWLMRSLNVFPLSSPEESQAVIPIELVDISPTAKSKLPKTKVSPKLTGSKLFPATVKTTPRNQNSPTRIVNQQQVVVSSTPVKPLIKKTVSQPKPTPTKKPESNFQPPTNSEHKPRKSPPTPKVKPSPSSTGKISTTPTKNEQGGWKLIITPFTEDEIRRTGKDLPDVLAKYQGSNTKKFPDSVNGGIGLGSAEFVASLIIDENGKFQRAVVLKTPPPKLNGEKSLYEQAMNELFRNEKFIPAQNQDGSKPEFSNLFVRITIQSGQP